MSKYSFVVVFFIFITLFFGCSQKSENGGNSSTIDPEQSINFPMTFTDMTKYYYDNINNSVKFPEFYILDRYYFYRQHKKEIIKSLRVKDSLVTKNISVVFLTYSISSVDYNDVLWFRKVDDRWLICASQYFSSYSDDPFGDGLPEGAKEIIKRADDWKKKNKSAWWE